jgi:hypothetical protein
LSDPTGRANDRKELFGDHEATPAGRRHEARGVGDPVGGIDRGVSVPREDDPLPDPGPDIEKVDERPTREIGRAHV